jgi:hypothetical protein
MKAWESVGDCSYEYKINRKMNQLKKLFTVILTIVVLFSCNKNDDNGEPDPIDEVDSILEDDYCNYPTYVEKVSYAFVKATFPFIDKDDDLNYDFELIDEFMDKHNLMWDFLNSTYKGDPEEVKDVIKTYRLFLDRIPQSSYKEKSYVEQFTNENYVSERVLLMNHLTQELQLAVYDYIKSHDEFNEIPRFLNLGPAYSQSSLYESGYPLFDERFNQELISYYSFSSNGELNNVILSKEYDIMGYHYGDCVKTMSQEIMGDFLETSLIDEIQMNWHSNVVLANEYVSKKILNNNYDMNDFKTYLTTTISYNQFIVIKEETIDNGVVKQFNVSLQSITNPIKKIHATIIAEK